MTTRNRNTTVVTIAAPALTYFLTRAITLSALLMLFGTAVHAATFHPISSITSRTAATDLFPAIRMIEGAGVGFDVNAPHDRTGTLRWLTKDLGGPGSDYFNPTPDPAPRLVLDLGSNVSLSEISVWVYGAGAGALSINEGSVSDFNLQFATAAEGTAGFGSSITFNPTYRAALDPLPRQSFPFGQDVIARYVEFTPLNNHFGGPDPGGDRVGLSEIAFENVPVPEPSTLALAALGLLGLLGWGRRNRRRAAA